MQDMQSRTMPTGISSLDPVMEGGIPPGSLILLLGDIGAGSSEFIYTSIMLLSQMKTAEVSESQFIPEQIHYVTFTKGKDDVIGEMKRSFHPDMARELESIRFRDLSTVYFDSSVIPLEWYSNQDIMTRLQSRADQENMLAVLAGQLNTIPPHSLIVLDSITDLAVQYNKNSHWKGFAAFLRGLQRISKEWDSVVYLPLTRGILAPPMELEVADTVDAVLLFRWEETTGARRQRVMYIEKFRGMMPHLEEKDLVKFAVRISSASGFEVSNIRVVI